ncbi:unnamed protein product [Sphagnum jensenii]|uniref:Protein kinase domain-containing protein n=1 Tax=Sphagnum jensenii TaxID=128206 RepID=A0ABP1BNM0_9BRYO
MTGTSWISTSLRDRRLQLPARRRMSPCLQIIVAEIMPLVLCVYVPFTRAQPGFVSIDYGSSTTYNETNGITWVPDTGYTFTGRNYVPNPKTINPLDSLRYFPENRDKNCYVLAETPKNFYMVRESFFYPDFLNSSFRLEMEAQLPDPITFQASSLTIPKFYEAYLSATSDNIYVCLARSTTTDIHFISSHELRPLDTNNMYQILAQGNSLYNDYHANFGSATPLIRYPYDPYLRPWFINIPGVNPNSTQLAINTTSSVVVDFNHSNEVPEIVMQTADSWPKGQSVTITTSFLPDYNKNYYIAFDFAEIAPQAESQWRIFSLALNGKTVRNNMNVANLAGGIYMAVEIYFDDIMLNSTGSLELSAHQTSQLGPILNALELFVLTDPAPNRTFPTDALSIESVKESLNLTSWTGDPCLHTPNYWIKCNNDTIPRVITVDLSNYNLTGIVPEALNNTTPLPKLCLNNNTLRGPIPNLSALTDLQSLRLEDNILIRYIPTWLASLPSLQELLLSHNNFTGLIPRALLENTNLTFEDSGNPQLCDASNACPPSMPPASQSNGDHKKKNNRLIYIILGCLGEDGFPLVTLEAGRQQHEHGVSQNDISVEEPALVTGRTGRQQGEQQILQNGTFTDETPLVTPRAGRPEHQLQRYNFVEVSRMTDGFAQTQRIGKGGSCEVYLGKLGGREVAVKRARKREEPGPSHDTTEQFRVEMDILSAVNHENVVSLLGYCLEHGEKILILEYMQNGTVQDKLYGTRAQENPMKWNTRLDIALNAARGLAHLHGGTAHPIVHRDIKTSNILLSEDMVAKVADLGVSKLLLEPGASHISTAVKGTIGYIDPNFFNTGQLTLKSDVFSFGIVLLELICGRPPVSKDKVHIGNEAKLHMKQHGRIDGLIDEALENNYNNIESIREVAKIALKSIKYMEAVRPTMQQVMEGLEWAINTEINGGTRIRGTHFFDALSNMPDSNSASTPEDLEWAIEIETNGGTKVNGTHFFDALSNISDSNSTSTSER